MIFTIAKFITSLFGWDISKVQRWVSVAFLIVMIAVVLVPVMLVYKACNKPPKLDEKQIQKAEQAIKNRNDIELKQILAESDTQSRNIDAGIKQAEENTRQAVKNYDGMTTDELAAEIERRKSQ